jgi:ABC-2 type transport system ATP-binding protein
MTDAILLKSVRKTFGETKAVTDLDLAIPRGALYGFIGPNGAGKTTTIRMIMAILFPDSGEVSVLGHATALEAKSRIGYLPEERGVYRKMRVGPFLTFMARLKGVPEPEISGRIKRGLARVGLADAERKRCEELSKGTQQKIQFIATIIHEPDLLILDEPFSGLDPVSSGILRQMVLEEHARGATILFSTHVMPHAEELCDHVVMINKGQKVLDDPVADIRRRYDPRIIEFDPLEREADLSPLSAVPDVESVIRLDGGGCKIVLREGASPAAAIPRLATAVPPARIEIARPTLEEVFVKLVAA